MEVSAKMIFWLRNCDMRENIKFRANSNYIAKLKFAKYSECVMCRKMPAPFDVVHELCLGIISSLRVLWFCSQ